MTSISKFFAAGRGWLKCVLEWRRQICSRNGSNDARRAQAKRLIVQQSYTVGQPDLHATKVLFPLVQEAMGSGTYCPNRQSFLCTQKHCGFWKHCEGEFGGAVRPAA